MSHYIKVILILINGILLFSCAAHKNVDNDIPKIKLERKRNSELITVLDSVSKSFPHHFYSKIKTNYIDTNRNNSFKTSIKLAKDSAVQALVTYANIPIANTLITKDSLKLTNKKDKCFIKKDLGYFKELFGVDFNYKNVEEIILGLPVDYDSVQKYFQIHGQNNYVLSSHRKFKQKRLERKAKSDFIINYHLSPSLTMLQSTTIESPSDSTFINIEYVERELIDGYLTPKEVLINITTPRNNIHIELSYDKVEVNLPQLIELDIPESYEVCE